MNIINFGLGIGTDDLSFILNIEFERFYLQKLS